LNIKSTALEAAENKMKGYFNQSNTVKKVTHSTALQRSFEVINEVICHLFLENTGGGQQ